MECPQYAFPHLTTAASLGRSAYSVHCQDIPSHITLVNWFSPDFYFSLPCKSLSWVILLPMQVLEIGTSLLHRLQFYEIAARFLVAGSQLLDLPQTEDPVPMRDASVLVSEASSALISLAEALSEPWTLRDPSQAAIPDLGAATGGVWCALRVCRYLQDHGPCRGPLHWLADRCQELLPQAQLPGECRQAALRTLL